MLRPLENKSEIRQCFNIFRDAFSKGVAIADVKPGGHKSPKYTVHWHTELGIWSCFVDDWRETEGKPDWSALFGIDKPPVGGSPRIEFEVNYLQSNPSSYYCKNARWIPAGRYMKDPTGTVYIGRTLFFTKGKGEMPDLLGNNASWESRVVACDWNKRVENILLLGRVDDPILPKRIAAAAKNLYNIKEHQRFSSSEISPDV